MKAREILGKRIVGVQESFQQLNAGRFKTLDALALDDGTQLCPLIHEGEIEHGVTLVVNKTGKKRKVRREITNENVIELYFHCAECIAEKPADKSPREWAQLEAGFTPLGVQVWCRRYERNVVHIDFEGVRHSANLQ